MKSISVRYLEPTQIRAFRLPGAVHPRIEIVGEQTILSANLKRVFPLSRPQQFISIQDGLGHEVGILSSTEGLDPESAALVAEEIDRRYFTPQIAAVRSLKQEAGMWHFKVDTQRGPAEFYVRNWRDSAYEIAPNRWQIMSVDGGRFEISNLSNLDEQSKRFMDQLL